MSRNPNPQVGIALQNRQFLVQDRRIVPTDVRSVEIEMYAPGQQVADPVRFLPHRPKRVLANTSLIGRDTLARTFNAVPDGPLSRYRVAHPLRLHLCCSQGVRIGTRRGWRRAASASGRDDYDK